MSNPLFQQFANNQSNPMSQFMQEFRQLQKSVQNPKQVVENLLQTGQMSQQQFNQLSQMANQIIGKN